MTRAPCRCEKSHAGAPPNSQPPTPGAGPLSMMPNRDSDVPGSLVKIEHFQIRPAAPGELSDLRGRRAQHPDCNRCFLSDISGWRDGALYPLAGRRRSPRRHARSRRLLAAVADSFFANAGSGDDGAGVGAAGGAGRAQRPTGSPCAAPRSQPH